VKILFATQDYPFPVNYGGRVYSGNVIRELARMGELSVHCLHPGIADVERFVEHDAHWTRTPLPKPPSKLAMLASRYPSLTSKHVVGSYWTKIAEELVETKPDILVFDYIAVGWIANKARALIRKHGLKTRTVHMSHNVETLLRRQIAANYRGNAVMRLLARYDSARAALLERNLSRSDAVTVITEEDAQTFGEMFHPRRVVPMLPGYSDTILEHRTIDASVPPDIAVLGGRLSTMKQIVLDEFLESAGPGLIAAGQPVHVIGPMTDGYLAKCRAAYPALQFHGFVEDVDPMLEKMRLGVIADHVGGGFKLRILTHIFRRLPIVAAPEVMAGLPLVAGEDYLPIASYADVPIAVAGAIDDFARLNAMQENAFAKCRSAFSWERSVSQAFAAIGAAA
jgi:glycosyltransferase involved in cell wall biosynthesis